MHTNEDQSAVLEVLFQDHWLIEDDVVGFELSAVMGRVQDLLLLLTFAKTAHERSTVVGLVGLTPG